MLLNMLQCFKANDNIKKTGTLNRNFGDGPYFELKVSSDVLISGVLDRVFIDINPNHGFCSPGEQTTSIAFTAREIQHFFVSDKLGGKGVSMQMLITDRCFFQPGNITFTGPFQ